MAQLVGANMGERIKACQEFFRTVGLAVVALAVSATTSAETVVRAAVLWQVVVVAVHDRDSLRYVKGVRPAQRIRLKEN